MNIHSKKAHGVVRVFLFLLTFPGLEITLLKIRLPRTVHQDVFFFKTVGILVLQGGWIKISNILIFTYFTQFRIFKSLKNGWESLLKKTLEVVLTTFMAFFVFVGTGKHVHTIVWKRAAWTFIKISNFVFHRRKSIVWVWMEWHQGVKGWQNCNFWWTVSLRVWNWVL